MNQLIWNIVLGMPGVAVAYALATHPVIGVPVAVIGSMGMFGLASVRKLR